MFAGTSLAKSTLPERSLMADYRVSVTVVVRKTKTFGSIPNEQPLISSMALIPPKELITQQIPSMRLVSVSLNHRLQPYMLINSASEPTTLSIEYWKFEKPRISVMQQQKQFVQVGTMLQKTKKNIISLRIGRIYKPKQISLKLSFVRFQKVILMISSAPASSFLLVNMALIRPLLMVTRCLFIGKH